MIFTDRKITIRNGKSSINEPVILYRGDFEVSIKFTIMESKFRFKSGVNLVDSEKASFGQLAILAPYGGNVFSEVVKCEDGTVTFTLTKEMIDQLEEVGLYSFQIRLFDYYRESRVSIPPVEFGIEVREPVASEDHDNEVNNAIVGYSIAKVVDALNEKVPDTFDANGNYNKTDWETGDRITEGKLNKIEDALDTINRNEKADIATLDKRVTSNYNVLDSKIDQVATKGTTVEVLENATRQEINRQIADGTIAGLMIEDDSVSIQKCNFIKNNGSFKLAKISTNIGIDVDSVSGQANLFAVNNSGNYYTAIYDITPNDTFTIRCDNNSRLRIGLMDAYYSQLDIPLLNDSEKLIMDNFIGDYSDTLNEEITFTTNQTNKQLYIYLGFGFEETPIINLTTNGAVINSDLLGLDKDSIGVEQIDFISLVGLKFNRINGLSYNPELGIIYSVPGSFNKTVSFVAEVRPNETYTVKCSNNNRFRAVLFNKYFDELSIPTYVYTAQGYTGELCPVDDELTIDDTLKEFTFKTGADSKIVIFHLATNVENVNAISIESDQAYEFDKKILMDLNFQEQTALNLDKWKPPIQPNTWANSTMQSEEFLSTFYDSYVGTYSDGYKVTKESLGKCGDGIRDIYKYVFEPKNYTRTILLTSLMHAQEIVGGFGLARFIYYIMEEPTLNDSLNYVRNNVRIVCIPLQNPNGFDQTPRRFGTPNVTADVPLGVNVNSNFDSKIDRWVDLVYDADHNKQWNYKGTEPFSENETKVLVQVLKEYKYDIEFWIDCHTGSGWDQDVWYYYIEQDNIYKPKIIALESWLSDIWASKKGVNVSALKNRVLDANTSHKLRYAVTELGIPCATLEYVPGRFGGVENCSDDLWAYLLELSNLIFVGLSTEEKTINELQLELYNFKLKKEIEDLTYFKNTITSPNGKRFIQEVDENGNVTVKEFKMY